MQPIEFPYWDNSRTQPNGQSQQALAQAAQPMPNLNSPPPVQQHVSQTIPTTAIAQPKPVTVSISTDAAQIDITITPK